MCVGALVVQLVESWVYTQEDTGSNPRAGGKKPKKKHHKYPPAHPSVKRVPGLVLGEQSTLAVSHCPLMVVVGHRVPTPAVGGIVGTSCELLARAPGVLIAPAHRTCLVHRCPGLSRNA